jgi:hypothetical protein
VEYLRDLAPFLALAAVALGAVVALIAVVNVVGRNMRRHGDWLRLIELRVANLHKEKESAYVRSIQVGTLRPPPLSEARTVDMSELKDTQKLKEED